MVSPTTPSSLLALADSASPSEGRWQVPDGWQQGRGAWGGLVIAAIVRAASQAEASAGFPLRSVRSVSAQIVSPVVVGEALVDVTEVRRGSATATWMVTITSENTTAVHATVVFGDDRSGEAIPHRPPAPVHVPSWTDIPPVDIGPPLAPPFLQHLRMRPVSGLPYTGSTDDIVVWLSYPEGHLDAAAMLALVDGPWPVPLVRITEARPMATLSFMATALIDPGHLDSDQPLLFRSELLGEGAGYATERRQLWTPDGRLAVENLQLITIIK
jgi:hypothetical protein